MYTKREMGERLRSLLYPKTTDDAKLTLNEAMKAVSEARDKVIKYGILNLKNETRTILGNWLSEFRDVEVSYDEDRKHFYSKLPVGVIALPHDQGVYHVYFNNREESMFIPVTPAMKRMYRGSLAGSLEGEYGYYLLEDKIVYTQSMPTDCKVSMNLVAQSGDLGEYDFFPCDGAMVQDVLQTAAQFLMPQKQIPEDRTADNTSN